ncbi:MAG: hypothetical protein ACLQJR_15730 [Stellaceae bacterium]
MTFRQCAAKVLDSRTIMLFDGAVIAEGDLVLQMHFLERASGGAARDK